MTRSPGRRRSATLLLAAALIGGACGEPSQPSGSGTLPSQTAATAPASTGPFEPMVWPPDGDAPCDQLDAPDAAHAAYGGAIRRIRALDTSTVTFDLCAPDAAFPTRLALIPFAINDTEWLLSHIEPGGSGEQAIVRDSNGTGPYRLENWNRGSDISLARNDSYWGTAARNERLILRWSDDAAGRTGELRSGAVDGADDLGRLGLEAVADDIELKRDASGRAQHVLRRLQQHVRTVRQGQGSRRHCAWPRPGEDRRIALPAGLRGRDPLLAMCDLVRLRR